MAVCVVAGVVQVGNNRGAVHSNSPRRSNDRKESSPMPMTTVFRTLGMLALALALYQPHVAPHARAFGKQSTAGLQDQAITVDAVPIAHFEKAAPERTQFGKLTWRGGLILSSASPFFGGWSGLTVDRDGGRLLAVSDTGVWMTGSFSYDGTRPTGIAGARLGALRGFDGMPFKGRRDIDAEGVALLSGTLANGEILISFEQSPRILRYPVTVGGVGVPTAQVAVPAETSRLAANKSLEAVCTFQSGPAKGSVLTFAERFPAKDGSHLGWMRQPLIAQPATPATAPAKAAPEARQEPAWTPVPVQSIDGYDLTDCAGLPNGDLLLLERRYRTTYGDPLTGPKVRLRRFQQADMLARARVGMPVVGETLLEVGSTHEIDNMEGLAVHTDARGVVVLTLISDDNFNSYLQRNILLQFGLEVPPSLASPAAEVAKDAAEETR